MNYGLDVGAVWKWRGENRQMRRSKLEKPNVSWKPSIESHQIM